MAQLQIVIKLGGKGAENLTAQTYLAEEVAEFLAAGHAVTIVHGGGRCLTELGHRLGLTSKFVGGRRITDDGLIDAAKMAFAGKVGNDLAARLVALGIPAVAISGVAASLLMVHRRPPQSVHDEKSGQVQTVDFGWVGDIERVNVDILHCLTGGGYVPVISSLGTDNQGNIYNINADTVACAVASSLNADKLILMTDVGGVLASVDDPTSVISRINLQDIEWLFAAGKAGSGMLPKLAAVAAAVRTGVKTTYIVGWGTSGGISAAMNGQSGTAISRF